MSNSMNVTNSILFETSINMVQVVLPIVVLVIIGYIMIKSLGIIGGRRMKFNPIKIIGAIVPLVIILIVGQSILSELNIALNENEGIIEPEMDAKPFFYEPTEEENMKPLTINTTPTYNNIPINITYEELDYDLEMEKLYEGYDSLIIDVDDSLDMDLESI